MGTPVTAETFKLWTIAKKERRQLAAEERVKAEQAKKKGGKGLSILSGRELFNYNAALFVDDEGAMAAEEENALALQTKIDKMEEENREIADAARAQAEQLRLQEAHRLEEEHRHHVEEERRARAKIGRDTFLLGNITINQVVFEIEEKENLQPFDEEWEARNAASIAYAIEMAEMGDEEGEEEDVGEEEEDDEDDDDDMDEDEDEDEDSQMDEEDSEDEDNDENEDEIEKKEGKERV